MSKWVLLLVGALFLVAGTGIGAGLMYIFDPDRGTRRRRYVMHRAQDMVDNANEVISDRAGDLRDQASDLRDQATSKIPDMGSAKMRGMANLLKKSM